MIESDIQYHVSLINGIKEKYRMSMGMDRSMVVMTGAMRGIGLAIAAKFSQEGSVLAILVKDDQSEEALHVKEDLVGLGGEIELVKCDIRSEEDIMNALDHIYKEHGRIDSCILMLQS